ncbi:hypothetical protein L0156_02670 [bacterium]|nr:hypothetical protein [bacterium]
MGEIRGAGKQPVLPTTAEPSRSHAQETTGKTEQDFAASQPLSSEGKAAKASESQISGEAMRQVLRESLLSASTSASTETIGGSYPVADKEVEVKPWTAEKTTWQPTSPAGVPYKKEARVPDNTPIFDSGKIDREKVLQSLSQHDQNSKTTEDKDRCGGTAVIASAISNGGEKGLLKLTGAMKKNLPADLLKDLNEIEKKIQDKTATHGDLGKLSELIHKGFAVEDPKGGKGILDGDMHSLYTAAGLEPPRGTGLPEKIFQNGQSWPVNLDTDGDGTPNHWVVAGKDEKGRTFIYDPESTPGKPQIHYGGSPEYDKYIDQMKKSHSGFAPLTKEDADRAREKYYGEGLPLDMEVE